MEVFAPYQETFTGKSYAKFIHRVWLLIDIIVNTIGDIPHNITPELPRSCFPENLTADGLSIDHSAVYLEILITCRAGRENMRNLHSLNWREEKRVAT